MKQTTRLSELCKLFNWQGGTIYQTSKELQDKGLSKHLTSVEALLEMNDSAFYLIKEQMNIPYTICKPGYALGANKPKRIIKQEPKPIVTKLRKQEGLII